MAITKDYLIKKAESKTGGVHPTIAKKAVQLVEKAFDKGILVLITQGLRSMEYQQELYNKGRSTAGPKVTNARPGYSYHNFGLAIDFAIMRKDGSVNWNLSADENDDNKKDWYQVGEIGESLGFEWGGRFTKFKDSPHLQMTFGFSLSELRSGKRPSGFAQPVDKPQPSSKGYVEEGDKGAEVKAIQKQLVELGYKIDVDGIFGPKTENAVESFQKSAKLAVDGIVGSNTLKALKNALEAKGKAESAKKSIRPYPGYILYYKKPYFTGKDVEAIQRAVGIPEKDVDGKFGPQLERYVKAYQKRHNLSVDGKVGPKTWAKMF